MFISVASLRPQYFKEITDIKWEETETKSPVTLL